MRNLTPEQIFAANSQAASIMQRLAKIEELVGIPRATPMGQSSFAAAVDASHAKPGKHVGGHAGEGGLQTHSVGGLYPYHPVAYGNGKWSIHNLVTGERTAAVFEDYTLAATWAERFKLEPREMAEFNALTKGQR